MVKDLCSYINDMVKYFYDNRIINLSVKLRMNAIILPLREEYNCNITKYCILDMFSDVKKSLLLGIPVNLFEDYEFVEYKLPQPSNNGLDLEELLEKLYQVTDRYLPLDVAKTFYYDYYKNSYGKYEVPILLSLLNYYRDYDKAVDLIMNNFNYNDLNVEVNEILDISTDCFRFVYDGYSYLADIESGKCLKIKGPCAFYMSSTEMKEILNNI